MHGCSPIEYTETFHYHFGASSVRNLQHNRFVSYLQLEGFEIRLQTCTLEKLVLLLLVCCFCSVVLNAEIPAYDLDGILMRRDAIADAV